MSETRAQPKQIKATVVNRLGVKIWFVAGGHIVKPLHPDEKVEVEIKDGDIIYLE